MTAPVQEPTPGRTDQGQEFRSRQLFRRPGTALLDGSLRQTGWSVVFGDGFTPVVTGDYQAIWVVPREIVGDGTVNWYIYDPVAYVVTPPTVDLELWIYRVRTDGSSTVSVSTLTDTPLVIDAGTQSSRVSANPVVVSQYANLYDNLPGAGNSAASLMIGIDVAGGAAGLSLSIPVGIEQPAGSGYHIP